MLKRLFKVILIATAVVVVPYLTGKFFGNYFGAVADGFIWPIGIVLDIYLFALGAIAVGCFHYVTGNYKIKQPKNFTDEDDWYGF